MVLSARHARYAPPNTATEMALNCSALSVARKTRVHLVLIRVRDRATAKRFAKRSLRFSFTVRPFLGIIYS
jgi:hypothetical protein